VTEHHTPSARRSCTTGRSSRSFVVAETTRINVDTDAPYEVLLGTGLSGELPGLVPEDAVRVAVLYPASLRALGEAIRATLALYYPSQQFVALDRGFVTPSVAVVTEQDLLGDRLVRRPKRKKSADAFLSELAAIGYRRFGAAMAAARAAATLPTEKGLASAKAYVSYARAHPGMYGLMFRTERLDMTRPSLREAADASFASFAEGIGAERHEQIPAEALTLAQAGALAHAWSLVHGFSTLLLDGRLIKILRRLPEGTDPETLLVAMLTSTIGRPPGAV
jgi:hypothetical protein